MLLFRPFGSGGSDTKLCYVLSLDVILVHSEIRGGEYHEGPIRELAMEVQVFVMLTDLLGVLDVATKVCKCGSSRSEVQSLTSHGEIQGLPQLVVPDNY
jgi:hypothetical protein